MTALAPPAASAGVGVLENARAGCGPDSLARSRPIAAADEMCPVSRQIGTSLSLKSGR